MPKILSLIVLSLLLVGCEKKSEIIIPETPKSEYYMKGEDVYDGLARYENKEVVCYRYSAGLGSYGGQGGISCFKK